MLKKLVLALAVMGLIGAAAGTASARGHGYRGGGYCYRPHHHHHHAFRPYYGAGYYRGPSSYFGPGYGYPGFGGYYGGFGGYGYGGSGIAIRIGF